jgi:hypothetical protein
MEIVPPPNATQRELIRQIAARWERAKQQLEDLRVAVRQQGALANAKLESAHLRRELDLAFRDLGEAVWKAYKDGQLKFPNAALPAARAVRKAEQEQQAYAMQIHDLLSEGTEAVERQQGKATPKLPPAKSHLAIRPKKR